MLIHQSLPCFLYNMFTSFVTRRLATEPATPEFESCWQHFAFELWQFRLPHLASVFRRRH